jgi:hypothetical protein
MPGFGKHKMLFAVVDNSGSSGGLPNVLSQRLLEIYRSGFCRVVTPWFSCRFLLSGLVSPAVSGEESGGVLRVEGDGSFVSYWWKRADSGALRVWLRENAESWTVDTSTGATDLRMTIDYSAATASLTPFTPDRIQTDQMENGRSCRWTLKVNWPAGDISFSSTGFTQTLTGEPVISTAQGLEPMQRSHYVAMRGLAASHPERGDFTVSVCIGQPRCTGVDEWECAVGLPGLHSSLRGQQGVNAFHACAESRAHAPPGFCIRTLPGQIFLAVPVRALRDQRNRLTGE